MIFFIALQTDNFTALPNILTDKSIMDIKTYFEILDKNSAETLLLAKSCSGNELACSPNGKWGILQILEHICITDKIVYNIVSSPSNGKSASGEILGKEKIKSIFVEQRATKITAPNALEPKGNITNVETFEKVFLQHRNLMKKELEAGTLIIDNRTYVHPRLGELTVTDWLNMIIHHTERHLEQIKDLKTEIQQAGNK